MKTEKNCTPQTLSFMAVDVLVIFVAYSFGRVSMQVHNGQVKIGLIKPLAHTSVLSGVNHSCDEHTQNI